MFDITPDDINQLNDSNLRELVGRLCEAELVSRGLSPAAVTWGGSQTAADGGLDVRVELPPNVSIKGFIPCTTTGFQVKKPDMPRAAIIDEMKSLYNIDDRRIYFIGHSNGGFMCFRLALRRYGIPVFWPTSVRNKPYSSAEN